MEPQSITSHRIGAPGTFSITHGAAWAASRSRVAASRSGYVLPAARRFAVPALYAWQGGDAWMASNPSSGKLIASAWWNSNG